jgi:hypothetical protein
MDPFLIFWWGIAALIIILFQDPNVPTFIELKFRRLSQVCYSGLLATRLAVSLAITRRSFRNDWLGRGLRSWELWSIQRNPAYRELFEPRPTPLQKRED